MKRIFVAIVVLCLCSVASMAQKPFLGVWQKETPDDYHLLCLDLYQKSMTTPDQEAKAYGYLQFANEFYADYWVISKLISKSENEARVKCFSWRYGEPDDEEDAVIKYNPVDKTLTFQRGDVPVIFQSNLNVPTNIKDRLYRNRDIQSDHEVIFLSFIPKNEKWLLEESHATYYDDGHSKYQTTKTYLGTLQGNKFVCTHAKEGFMLNTEELNQENMDLIEPFTFYYLSNSNTFWTKERTYIEK